MRLRRLATGALAVATTVGSLGIAAPAIASPVSGATATVGTQAAEGDIVAPAPRGHADQGHLTIPDVPNVRYLIASSVVGPGRVGPYSVVTVRAESTSAQHQLVGQTSWEFDLRRRAMVVVPEFDWATSVLTIPEVQGARYSLDGSPVAPGSIKLHPKAGNVWDIASAYQVTVAPKDETWVLEGDSFNSWFYRGAYLQAVTPAAPQFGERTVYIPNPANVTYQVDGEPVATGLHPVDGWDVVVTAHAASGYEILSNVTSRWVKNWSVELGAAPAPTFTGLSVTIPDVAGAVWELNGDRVQPGLHWAPPGVDQMKVTVAAAAEGEHFRGQTSWTSEVRSQSVVAAIEVDLETGVATPDANPYVEWHVGDDVHQGSPFTLPLGRRHTLKAVSSDPRLLIREPEVVVDLREQVTPPAPGLSAADFTVDVPNVEGFVYTARGSGVTVVLEPGMNSLPGSMLGSPVEVTVKMRASSTRRLHPASTTRWTFSGIGVPYVVMAPTVELLPSGKVQVTMEGGDQMQSSPWYWRVNGVDALGTSPTALLDERVFTVDAVAMHAGVRFARTPSWDFDLRTKVTPEAPTFDRDTAELTVDGNDQIIYLLDGVELSDGVHELTRRGVVTVKGTAAHAPQDPAVSWTFDGTPTPFTAPVPEQHGEARVIPYAQEVVYFLNGAPVAAGTRLESTRSVVTARPANRRWTLVGPTRWVFDLRRAVTPAAPVLDTDNARLTIPATDGVEYVMGGAVLEAGTHTVALPARVIVRAASATDRLSDGAQTEWVFANPSTPPTGSTPTIESPLPSPEPSPEPTPGGETPSGTTPGETTPGGSTPGGTTPGGSTPGGSTPGDTTPGGTPAVPGTPGGSTPTPSPGSPVTPGAPSDSNAPALPGGSTVPGGSTAPGGTTPPSVQPKPVAKKKAKAKKPKFTRRTGALVLRGTKGLTVTVKVMTGRKKVVRKVTLSKAGTKKVRLKRGQRAVVTITAKKGYVRSGKKSWTYRR